MTAPFTASQADRAFSCPASFALPSVHGRPEDYSTRGTEIHRFLELLVLRGREQALEEVPEESLWRWTCEGVDLQSLLSDAVNIEIEVTFAYNPLTNESRALRGGAKRENFSGGADEILGKADLIVTRVDGSTLVVDYKTGRNSVSVEGCGQVHLLGLAVARERRLAEVCVAVAHIYDDGSLGLDELLLRQAELEAVAQKVCIALERVKQAKRQVAIGHTPDVVTGGHCRYCPAFRSCPANTTLARSLLDADGLKDGISELTPGQAGLVWARVVRAKRILDEIEQGLKAYVDHTPIPLPDGKNEITRVESVRETIVGRSAVPVLHKYMGDAADEVIEPAVSKTALEGFIRSACENRSEARSIFNTVLSGLREAGAISESVIVSYRAKPIRNSRKERPVTGSCLDFGDVGDPE